jgi:hypothetical protein
MANKTLGDVIDLQEKLTDGLVLSITSIVKTKNKFGACMNITTVDNRKYQVSSEFVTAQLQQVLDKKFDFAKDILKVQVKGTVSENGREYLTLVSPVDK